MILEKKRGGTTRSRQDSVADALESANMLTSINVVGRERTFTGTIWDTPEEREQQCASEALSDEVAVRSNGSAHHTKQK